MKIVNEKRPLEVYGLWHGGINYASPSKEDLEIFNGLPEARECLDKRYRLGYYATMRFRYVFKETIRTHTPTVEHDSYIQVWIDLDLAALEYEDLPEPDRWVYFGPRGGIRVSEYFSDLP